MKTINLHGSKMSLNYKMCRICLTETKTKSMFGGTYENYSLNELFEICTSIQVRKEDGVPSNMCTTCISRLCHTFDFIKACKEADKKLRSVLLQEPELPTTQENSDCYFKIDDFIEEIDCKNGYDVNEEITEVNNAEEVETDFAMVSPETSENTTAITSSRPDDVKKKTVIKNVYKCRVCLETFDSSKKMKTHYSKAKHPGFKATRTCPVCSKVFYGKSRLDTHMLSHTKEKPYKCELCPRACMTKPNLRRHMLIHTGDKPFVCEICGKAFNQSYALTEHRRIHTNELPFMCSYCGKQLRTLAVYKNHILTHERKTYDRKEKEQLVCNICQQVLGSKASLRCHILYVHGEKPNRCSRCHKKFKTTEEKSAHVCNKTFSCKICGETFIYANYLVLHMRKIHTGERPYCCQLCGRGFIKNSQLKQHLRTHTGEKPHVCPFCNKGFALNWNLTIHMRIHSGETPHVCDICNKGFRDTSSLRKHQKSHHNKPIIMFNESYD